jgi:hypothetical protein
LAAVFIEKLKQTFETAGGKGELNNIRECAGSDLLAARRALVKMVGKGMHDRKDKELEIALAAAVVWFKRQEFEDRERILNML